MKKNISISVPNPCSEQWSNFTSTSTGGFCSSCSKNVIDFTKMGDDEIRDFFNNKPAHSCGRFRSDQLKDYTYSEPIKIHSGYALLKAGFVSLLLVLISKNASAQNVNTKTNTEVVQPACKNREEKNVTNNPDQIIKGVVKSQDDNQPLPGASVYLKGSTIGISTDEKGRFQFPQQLAEGDVITFSFIGFETQEYVIPKDASDVIEIPMAPSYTIMMGAVASDEVYTTKKSGLGKLWTRVKGLF